MENIRDILSENLKKFRGRTSQADICEKAGISLRYYQDIEKAKLKWPQPDKLELLAQALGVESWQLLSREDAPNPTLKSLSDANTLIVSENSALKDKVESLESRIQDLKSKLGNIPPEVLEILPSFNWVDWHSVGALKGLKLDKQKLKDQA